MAVTFTHPMKTLLRLLQNSAALSLLLAPALPATAFDAATLKPLGVNVGGVNYFTTPYFANAVAQGGEWLEFDTNFGDRVPHFNSAQFNEKGYPKFLNPGKKLRLLLFGLHTDYGDLRHPSWPVRDSVLANGKIVVEWTGDADIRLNDGVFLPGESNGPETGSLVNGRRVYLKSNASDNSFMQVESINAANPVTDLKVWLPDPADPQNATLEDGLFHPVFLQRLAEVDWAFLRMMDWGVTNANPQKSWSDRRLPDHVFQCGILNDRDPTDEFALSIGDRETGVAYEHIIALCNAANKDLWICIPHLADDDFITKLAQMIRFGSDGVNPHTAPVADPAFAPLNPNLRVYVEYSNEIWSNGFSFPQGNWAEAKAAQQGITRPQFNARQFCRVWRVFEQVFEGNDRLIKTAAVFTGSQSYIEEFLTEIKNHGATLTPPQEPDCISPTTYFGNDIQGFAFQRALEQRATTDPWFLTTGNFNFDGGQRPVSVTPESGYWVSDAINRHMDELFQEWRRRMLSGSTQTGSGPDATGIGGGFGDGLRALAQTLFAAPKPIVSYEGGPSLFTDELDGPDERDDGITAFMELVNRQPEMAGVYEIHLNQALEKGLRNHGVFVESGGWGKFGQWGHLESIRQSAQDSPKWQFLLDWETELAGLRHIDDVLGSAPAFATAAKLPTAIHGTPYTTTISTTGGDGARALKIIGAVLPQGLNITLNGGEAALSGTPVSTGESFLYLRVRDADGDPAWRTFFFRTVGGPGVLAESNFEGSDPALNLPWTPTYVLKDGVTYSGWTAGAGITPEAGDDGLAYSQVMPNNESTLAQAITAGQFWAVSVQGGSPLNLRNAEVRFTIRRLSFHAPRLHAVLTSVGGFSAAQAVFTTTRLDGDTNEQEFAFRLPDTAAFENRGGPVEFRIYGFAGQFSGHMAMIRSFKITPADAGAAQVLDLVENSITAAGQGYTIVVTTPGAWTAKSSASFAVVNPKSGTGNGSVTVTVQPNNSKKSRTAKITIAGAVHTLTQAAALPPTIDFPAAVAPLAVSADFSMTIPTVNPPVKYTIKGKLPPGLVFNQLTGTLSGKPATPGEFDFSITAANAAGAAPQKLDFSLQVTDLDGRHIGVFHGLAGRLSNLNNGLGNRVELTVAKTGVVSGKILTGTVSHAFTGRLDTFTEIVKKPKLVTDIKRGKLSTLVLDVDLDPDSNSLAGTLHEKDSPGISTQVSAWRNGWNNDNKATAFKAAYTFAIEPAAANTGIEAIPQGDGYGSFSVPDNGVVKVAGKLADGSAYTCSTFVGQQGEVLLYAGLYKNRGSLAGALEISGGLIGALQDLEPDWFKDEPLPNSKDRNYKAGFGPDRVEVNGGIYAPPAPGGLLMGLDAGQNNAALLFSAASLTHSEGEAPDVLVTLANPSATGIVNNASVPKAGTAENEGKVSIKLVSKTGLFSGKLTVPSAIGAAPRTVSYTGMIVNRPGASAGHGCFLLAKEPAPGQKANETDILSGLARLIAR
ncbi:MAG TPA: hypothetical protein DIT64_00935 [Verrucomicrobiales bacterium]|nr:hypothetical protein [Verrucomicrobiales bacterium]